MLIQAWERGDLKPERGKALEAMIRRWRSSSTLSFEAEQRPWGDTLVALVWKYHAGGGIRSSSPEHIRVEDGRLYISLGRRAGYTHAAFRLAKGGMRVGYVTPTTLGSLINMRGSETQHIRYATANAGPRCWERLRGFVLDVLVVEVTRSQLDALDMSQARHHAPCVVVMVTDELEAPLPPCVLVYETSTPTAAAVLLEIHRHVQGVPDQEPLSYG